MKPAKGNLVIAMALGMERWRSSSRTFVKSWKLSLECGHTVERVAVHGLDIPERIPCRFCALSGKTILGERPSHAELCHIGEKWLRNKGCGAVIVELRTAASEQPDVIGWQGHHSMLIECKTSPDDFRADLKKPSRVMPDLGPGQLRYYLAAAGVIPIQKIPSGWGLLEWVKGRVYVSREAEQVGSPSVYRDRQEIAILASALRRLQNPSTPPEQDSSST